MDKIFTFKEACEKGVTEIRNVKWPKNQYIEFTLVGTTPYPRCKLITGKTSYALPVDGIDPNHKTFTFANGIESYDEYFNKIEMAKLRKRMKGAGKK